MNIASGIRRGALFGFSRRRRRATEPVLAPVRAHPSRVRESVVGVGGSVSRRRRSAARPDTSIWYPPDVVWMCTPCGSRTERSRPT